VSPDGHLARFSWLRCLLVPYNTLLLHQFRNKGTVYFKSERFPAKLEYLRIVSAGCSGSLATQLEKLVELNHRPPKLSDIEIVFASPLSRLIKRFNEVEAEPLKAGVAMMHR
jgi:hypothetical protein